MVTVGGEEIDVAEIEPGNVGNLLMRALMSSTVRSVMFCWMMAVEDGLAVVATTRMVSATPGSKSPVTTTSSRGQLKYSTIRLARTTIVSSPIALTAWKAARIPTGETVKSTETVALKGGESGEGGGQGGEGGEGGEGGCVGGEGGGDGGGGGQLPKTQLEP